MGDGRGAWRLGQVARSGGLDDLAGPKQVIRAFVQETFLVDDFRDDASFLRTGVIDSIGVARLVAFLEETFQIAIADDELVLENLDSLDRVAAFVGRKLSRNAA